MSETLPDSLLASTLSVDDKSCFIYVLRQTSLVDGSFPWQRVAEEVLSGSGLAAQAVSMGRGGIFFLSGAWLPFPIVVRQYRHGGLWRLLSGARFFSQRRFMAELKLHTIVRELGVSAPEPLGVIVAKKGPKSIFVNGYYVTRRLPDSVDLPEFLQQTGAATTRLRIAFEIGNCLRGLHEHGIFYTDLHVKNILIGPEGGVFFIDFDKAKKYQAPLSAFRRRANLYRFLRSVEKYCYRGGKLTDADHAAFLIAYEPDPKKYLKLYRQLGFGLTWRRLFYRFGWWLNRS